MNTDAKLGRELVAVLTVVAGDAGHTEGAVDCAKRIIRERNDARAALARANRRLARERARLAKLLSILPSNLRFGLYNGCPPSRITTRYQLDLFMQGERRAK